MDIPSATLAAMRKTNDLFCATVVRLRDMGALDHVYTPEALINEGRGGRLWARSNAPRGAIFQFTLPAQSSVAPHS